jgi:hypothetical protein
MKSEGLGVLPSSVFGKFQLKNLCGDVAAEVDILNPR